MNEQHQAWLDGLKVGDEVAVTAWIGRSDSKMSTVARITKTLIIVDRGRKFRKQGGSTLGRGYGGSSLCEPTHEIRDKIERYQLYLTLGHVNWLALPLATLRKVNELVKAASGKAAR